MHDRHEQARERSLDEAVARLESEIQPRRDLWPDIAASLPARRRPARRHLALAASLVAAALGGMLAAQYLPWGASAPVPLVETRAPDPLPGHDAFPPAFLAAEATFREARAQRMEALGDRLEQLSPESRAAVAQSLATIEQALHDLRTALAEEPADPVLQNLLLNVYSQELAVLGQLDEATRVATDGSIEI